MRKQTPIDETKARNPFIETLEIQVRTMLIRAGKHPIYGKMVFEKEVEEEHRVMVYPMHLAHVMLDMTKTGQVLLFYIFNHLTYNQDYLQITFAGVESETSLAKSPYYRALHELINLAVIMPRPSRKNTYWINPRLFFCGSRVSVYNDKVKSINESVLSQVMEEAAPYGSGS